MNDRRPLPGTPGVHALVRDIRELAEDATAPHGERRQSRTYLRKMICRRLRELETYLDKLGPPAGSGGSSPH